MGAAWRPSLVASGAASSGLEHLEHLVLDGVGSTAGGNAAPELGHG